MNIFKRFKNKKFFDTPYKKAITKTYSRRFFNFFNGDLATNETILSAVNLLSNSIASIPIGVYKDSKKLKCSESNLAYLLKFGVNDKTTTTNFIKILMVNLCTTGKAYAIIERGKAGEVTGIYPLRSSYITPSIDKDSDELYFEVSTEGGPYYIHSSNMIYLQFISSDGITAINPLEVLRGSINYDNKVKEFSLEQMQNSLDINYVFKVGDAKLSPENRELYNQMIQTFFDEGIAIVDAAGDLKHLSDKSFIDPNIAVSDKITIERVERVYGLQGKLSKSADNRQGEDTEDLIFLKDTILPLVRQFEQEFTRKCLSYRDLMNDLEIKFNLNGLARATLDKRTNYYVNMLRSGVLSPNMILELEGLPTYEDGDTHFFSRDLCPSDLYSEFMEATISEMKSKISDENKQI